MWVKVPVAIFGCRLHFKVFLHMITATSPQQQQQILLAFPFIIDIYIIEYIAIDFFYFMS